MNKTEPKWGVIVNPHSGNKISLNKWNTIYYMLKKAEIHFDSHFTNAPGHAVVLAKNLVEKGYTKILVVGGDGTLNEAVNGIYSSDISPEKKKQVLIGIIPSGTGNDWGRFWGIKRNYKKAVDYLHKGKIQPIDLGLCSYSYREETMERYFINAAGCGFDGTVVYVTNFLKNFLGGRKWVYSFAVLATAFIYKVKKIELQFNGETIHDKIYTLSIGNGCYTGGGIKQTPDAVPYDGLFDVTIVRKPSFFQIITGLVYLFQGRLLEHPCVKAIKTTAFSISGNKKIKVEADGLMIEGDNSYHIQLIPNAIQMLVP
jgi:diacylglycerol kinase (ATP)